MGIVKLFIIIPDNINLLLTENIDDYRVGHNANLISIQGQTINQHGLAVSDTVVLEYNG